MPPVRNIKAIMAKTRQDLDKKYSNIEVSFDETIKKRPILSEEKEEPNVLDRKKAKTTTTKKTSSERDQLKPKKKPTKTNTKPRKAKTVKEDKTRILLTRKPEIDQFAIISIKDVNIVGSYSEYTVMIMFSAKKHACSLTCSCKYHTSQHKSCNHILFVTRNILGLTDEATYKKDDMVKNWPLGAQNWPINSDEIDNLIKSGVPNDEVCFHCGQSQDLDQTCQSTDCKRQWHGKCRDLITNNLSTARIGCSTRCVYHAKLNLITVSEPKEEEVEDTYDPNAF